jgi:hypothetical protein
MMKVYTFYFLILTLLGGCVLSKRLTDHLIEKHVLANPGQVKSAAEFAVAVTLDSSWNEFQAEDIVDPEMRKQVLSLGRSVYVTYQAKDSPYEIRDSNVTFITITLAGVTEIIYDFAAAERNFPENKKNRQEYYFIKLADRIYYRRRVIPMM